MNPRPRASDLREEQQEEMAHTWAGPGVMSGGQVRGFGGGAVIGGLTGGVIGLLLLVPFAFIDWGADGFDLWLRLLLCALVGAIAGSTVGAVYLAGREPQREGETEDLAGQPLPDDRRSIDGG